jgi:hypothetical protein
MVYWRRRTREVCRSRPITRMNIVEYFEMRKREADQQLAAIETGRVRRLVQETDSGSIDVTNAHKEQLRQASKDYWRAAENLKRINSSQK